MRHDRNDAVRSWPACQRRCVICGGTFLARVQKGTQTCSATCAHELGRPKLLETLRPKMEATQVRRERSEEDRRRLREERRAVYEERKLERYRMKYHRRRARKRGVEYETINPRDVYERDGWRCHVCGRLVPQRLRIRSRDLCAHPLYPTLDHLVPLSGGGSHTWGNVALAHNECNSLRDYRGVPVQLLIAV